MRKKVISALLAAGVAAAALTGCGKNAEQAAEAENTEEAGENADSSHGTDDGQQTVPLKYEGEILIWVDDAAVSVTEEQLADFQQANPGISQTVFTVEAVSEEDAAERMLSDPAGGADVYIFAQDKTKRLAAAGALQKVPDSYKSSLTEDADEGALQGAAVEGELYAYPVTADGGYLLYYDKSVVRDPSDLDRILEDCEKAGKSFCMELNSGWYQPAFFFGTGCSLSYETDEAGNFISAEMNYASPQGLVALKEMIHVKSSSAFVNGSAAGDIENPGALIDGIWDADLVEEKLGENYACAKLPSFTGADGETYQMSGFAGYRLLGVKPQKDENRQMVCDALAAYLSGSPAQLARYEAAGWGPSGKAARKSGEVSENKALCALQEQLSCDRLQGEYPGDYWTLAMGLGDDVNTGTLNAKTSDADLMTALQTFQDTCISYAEEDPETEEEES